MSDRDETRLPAWIPLIVVILAAGARIAWLNAVPTQPTTDFAWYFERAIGLSQGEGYAVNGVATAYWPAGYPYVLSLVLTAFGASVEVARNFNAILTTLIALVACSLTFRITGSKLGAALVGVALAIHPTMLAYSGILASEPLFALATLLSIWMIVRATRSRFAWFACGLMAGLATMVRPQAILQPFLNLVGLWPVAPNSSRNKPKPWVFLIGSLIGLLIALAPIMMRNKNLFGEFFLVSTNGGDNLWIGHTEGADGRYRTPPGKPDTPANELANDKRTKSEAIAAIQADPSRSLALIPAKLQATFLSGTDAPYWAFQFSYDRLETPGMDNRRGLFLGFKQINIGVTIGLLITAGIAFVLSLGGDRGRRMAWICAVQIAWVALVTSLFFGNGRFGFVTIPFQVMLIGGLVASLQEWIGKQPLPDPWDVTE